MSWPLPSVEVVRVSLHVTTTHGTFAGAPALCSRAACDPWESGFGTLSPYRIRLQPLDRGAFADVFVKDGRHVGLFDLGVPRGVRVDDDGRPVFAWSQTRRPC